MMKLSLSLSLLLGSSFAQASDPGALALDRLQKEVYERRDVNERLESLSFYAGELFRESLRPSSWGGCFSSVSKASEDLSSCRPSSVKFARGGTGGVE